jgi:hypothetical protein
MASQNKRRSPEPPAPDPVLSPQEMADDAGISLITWRRNYRDQLPILQISPRRIGCRQSQWRAALGEAQRR